MFRTGPYVFKRAETSLEFEQIHRLNCRTFAHEIPQHVAPADGRLIDKFHHKSVYFIGARDQHVVAMVSAHGEPPFSVADRMSDPSILAAPESRPLEVRLLAVEPEKRNSLVFFGLLWTLYEFAEDEGYTHLFISGVSERLGLYRRLGFEALGPASGQGKASFVPMALKIGALPAPVRLVKQRWEEHVERSHADFREPVCLLPGPVTTSASVRAAFHRPPIYHRGPEFIELFEKVRQTLSDLVGGRDVALFNGSGTLANETVAATLAAEPAAGRGVLLSNGEFGERLARQALRFGLKPRILRWVWGQPWDLDEIDAVLAEEERQAPKFNWIWGVHHESSTGVLNDLPELVRIGAARGVRVCADCISSLGAVPLDLAGVYLASASTGKALGAYAGAAIVFADRTVLGGLDLSRVPSYLDLPAALATRGPRYTFPSPTLQALDAALEKYATAESAQATYARYFALGRHLREQLRHLGLGPLAQEIWASPVVATFAPPGDECSEDFVRRCRSWGYEIGGQSGYLAERRLVQIAVMGAVEEAALAPLFERLAGWLARTPAMAH